VAVVLEVGSVVDLVAVDGVGDAEEAVGEAEAAALAVPRKVRRNGYQLRS